MTEATFRIKISIDQELDETRKAINSDEPEGLAGIVVKSQEEQRYTLSVAYPANRADVARAQDGFIDAARPEAVEKAAWEYLRRSPHVGLWHQEGTSGSGEVCESYIYRGPDWTVHAADGSAQLIKAGDWLLGIIWNESSWPLVRAGIIGGVSPQGRAKRANPSPELLDGLKNR